MPYIESLGALCQKYAFRAVVLGILTGAVVLFVRMLILARASRIELQANLDEWMAAQGNQTDANRVKQRILTACAADTSVSFNLNVSDLQITSLPSCLSRLNVRSLNCSDCPRLTELSALPSCTTLVCYNCPLLRDLPQLQQHAHVYSAIRFDTCMLPWRDLHENRSK